MNLSIALRLVGSVVLFYVAAPAAEAASPQSDAITNSIGMKLMPIPAGSFTMGQDGPASDYHLMKHSDKFDDADWDERPAHKVVISAPFHMAATEVTLGQYRAFKTSWRAGKGHDDDAVVGVSWHDAVAFCRWLSAKEGKTYRLPTEAEWEYACRAGTTTLFHTGDTLPPGFHKWFGESGFLERYFPTGNLSPEYRVAKVPAFVHVGQTPVNAWGLFDMHGNVAEWCQDWYGPYEAGEQTDPLGRTDGDFRIFRGGNHSTFTRLLRSANRSSWIPEAKNEKTGFRVVLGELPKGMPPPPKPPLNAQNVDQSLAKIAVPPADVPYFAEPKPFVIIPPESFGPLFSVHNHSPAITECPNGDLLAVWYSCVEESGSELNNVASRLRRGAEEWESASLFWDGADVNDHAPKLCTTPDGTLYHFARGYFENIVRTSTDNGASWSKAHILQPHGEYGADVLQTRAGLIILTQDSRETSLVVGRDGDQKGEKVWTFTDAHRGKSDYRAGGKGFRHPGIHAPIVELADGRLMAISRLNSPEEQQPFDFKTPISFTSDLGATWTYEASPFPAISSVQRQVLMRLHEGPLLLCSFTDVRANWKQRKGLTFPTADGGEFTGYGLFAALSFDDGKTWPVRKLLTPGGPERELPSIDRSTFTLSDTMAESGGYLTACQTRDNYIQLLSSKNHYTFNLAWLKQLPSSPAK